jgi:NADP-dependent 3-hydroxy acid dehydrogenase YdfG
MDLGLRGRLAVVGGATAGLGQASADALAAEGCDLLNLVAKHRTAGGHRG